ncbi:histidine kinase [bacterium]|nr:histidine kinase [bacterium]
MSTNFSAAAARKERFVFYVWLGIIYFGLMLLFDVRNYPDTYIQRTINSLWLTAYILSSYYFLFEYGLPYIRFTLAGIFASLLVLLLWLLLISLGLFFWRYFGIWIGLYSPYLEYASLMAGVYDQFQNHAFSLAFFGIAKHLSTHYRLRLLTQQLHIEKQQAELSYIKAQTNPHFLFNTLNNIYSLARDKSNLAPESILRLSKILRYMIYDASNELIDIEKEINIIEDYLALEKLRYDHTLHIVFEHTVDKNHLIPPLLLIPLVENAFKHGASQSVSEPFVRVYLTVAFGKLEFKVENSIDSETSILPGKENIGHQNLKRQLELMFRESEFSVEGRNNVYTAILKINLGSYVTNKLHHR